MDVAVFGRYIDAFNSGDDETMVNDWFADDFIYVDGERTIEGTEAWLSFLRLAHDGIREIFRPQSIYYNESGVFCEIDMDFHAIKPRPDFPFGPLAPGEMYTVKFFVGYEVDGGRFRRLKAAIWPVNRRVSVLPRLGAHVSQRAALEGLVAALVLGDRTRAAKFFAEPRSQAATSATEGQTAIDLMIALAAGGRLGDGRTGVKASAKSIAIQAAGGQSVVLTLADGLIAAVAICPDLS